ncbi:hypothetical protein HN587_04735 [Candidatus Woesearchaeota archaeon]|jgi:hypothetical protein|nr:hypothetical protein [Candidatus Woesearchaeota archaeon]
MKVKKTVKKIVALGVGITMMGATLLGAMATPYTLADYPQPFVMDGAWNGLMVVGDDAAPADIIGVTDIAMELQYSATVTKSVSTGTAGSAVALEGDAWEAKTSSKLWELGENLTAIQSVLDETDLNALEDGTFKNSKGTFGYEQTLTFYPATAPSVSYTVDEDDVTGDFLLLDDSDDPYARYSFDFTSSAESDVVENEMEDFHNKKITMLGKEYTIVDTAVSSGEPTFTLMAGAVQDVLEEGETKTYTLGGKEFEVTALIISDTSTSVKFKVNGETTDAMTPGDIELLSDGTQMGIREILPNEAGETAGGDIVEFYIGADKLVLENGTTIEINEEKIEETLVTFDGDFTAATWDGFTIDYNADDTYYIPAGGKLSEFLDEPEGLMNWDIAYEGLTAEDTEMIKLVASGDDEYKLKLEVADGEVTIPLAYSGAADVMNLGDKASSSKRKYLILDKTEPLQEDDYFVLTTGGAADQGDESFVLQYKGSDKTTGTDNGVLKFKNLATGETIERSLAKTTCDATLRVGGVSYAFNESSAAGCLINDINVSLKSASQSDTTSQVILSKYGAKLSFNQLRLNDSVAEGTFDNLNTSRFLNVVVEEVNSDMVESTNKDIIFKIGPHVTGTDELSLDYDETATALQDHEENDDLRTGFTPYGALISYMTKDNAPDELEISWPSEQQYAQVFVTSGAVESSMTSAGGDVTYEVPVKIEVGAAVLASQVPDVTSANIVSVGGSCINEVTAAIMGLTYPACGEASGLSEGEAIVKLYESGDSVAIVVAGWEAEDTTRATRVLANYEEYQAAGQLVGSEVKVTGTSLTDVTVTPVTSQ